MNLTQMPLRVTTGTFILNSGVGKLKVDEGTAAFLHNGAKTAYPGVFDSMDPKTFSKVLSYSEIGVGALLLAPMVSPVVAGAALTGFGASLVRMYLKTPGMTQSDGIRPTQEGTGVAKDVWLVGAGLTLLTQGLTSATKAGAKSAGRGVRQVTPFVES